jgi:phage major head subunit gpT-like protein
MGAQTLSSRAIIGEFYRKLAQSEGAGWINPISMLFNSDQGGEEYVWLGQTPAMKEWVGGRLAKGFTENGFTLKNKHYEATLEVRVPDLRRDKTGQVMVRIQELAQRTNSHWASLLSALIVNGASNVCYDGQFFFDTDHEEGGSGAQSNSIDVDISALPAKVHGAITAPSPEELQQTILKGVTQIQSFVDDQGEPMNEDASNFLVMVPTSLSYVASNAMATMRGTSMTEQLPMNINVSVAQNPRLNAWTDKVAIFRTDGSVSPFIRQQETAVQMKAKAEGSAFEFDNDAHQYGVDSWRNVGYGYWQDACLATMI